MTARSLPPILLSVFPGFGVGGAQVRFAAVANRFGRQYRHFIIAINSEFDAQKLLNADIDVTFLPIGKNNKDLIPNLRSYRSILRKIDPDLLVTHNWGAIEWAMANWRPSVPHVHIEDGFGPEEAHRQLPRRVWMRRLVLRNSTVVVPSRVLARLALDVWKLRPSTVKYLPNGIDTARFSNPANEPLLPRDGMPTIGTVAALRKEKNLDRLLEAFRILRGKRPSRLMIAGDGAERAALERRAAEMGLAADVVFPGYRADTERIYASLDLFALSSDTEQMPTSSVLEAMAAGLPVASTDVGDVRNMVSAENTSFVVPRDAVQLADALDVLLENPDMRRAIGAANRAQVKEEFAQEKMFARYEALFDQARNG